MGNDTVHTIRELLNRELKQRYYVSGIDLTADKLFEHEKLRPWINALVGESVSGKLAACIDKTSGARLSHAAAAYLLGMALRSNLQLHFDLMPQIIAHSASDGFHFFWALICLCHDLGYRFENDSPKNPTILLKMTTARGRMELLGIEHNLFEVDRAELFALGINPDSEDGKWILESVELAKKYDRYRRQTNHKGESPVADHGICGALLLYDILRTECEQMRRKHRRRRFDHPERHADNETKGNLDGASKDSSPTRFIRCGLLIACTIARHNMWLASTEEQKSLYRIYGLEVLFAEQPNVKVRADSPMEQMLFFLDFVDTIDPAKWFYLRDVENGPAAGECDRCYQERLQKHYHFMLDRIQIDFAVPSGEKERGFSLLAVTDDYEEQKLFEKFSSSTASLTDWLETPAPAIGTNRITYTIPFTHEKEKPWPCKITNDEVNSLLLYMGCGVPGLYGAFYSSSRAYQTFNLLMMPGNKGEQIRVCEEQQKPNGVFLREWKRSMETMEDIFRAQCKYARKNPPVQDLLFRSDRALNFEMMYDRKATYAMTSTSQGSYLPEFLVEKVEPHILSIRMTKPIPYFDYEGFFAEEYVYADEREILLPPMVSLDAQQQSDFTLTAGESGADADIQVRWYDVTLGSFDPDSLREEDWEKSNDDTDRAYLSAHAKEAAEALDHLAQTHDWKTSPLSSEKHVYWQWKRAYRRVLRRQMQEIYRTEFKAE